MIASAPAIDIRDRDATGLFGQRGIGDVLPAFGDGIALRRADRGALEYRAVVPPPTAPAHAPVEIVAKRGTTATAGLSLGSHATPHGQEVFAKSYRRRADDAGPRRRQMSFRRLVTSGGESARGSGPEMRKRHSAHGNVLDGIDPKR